MSRIGKKPIPIKDVTINFNNGILKVKGKLGELEMKVHPNIKVEIGKEEIVVTRPDDSKENNHALFVDLFLYFLRSTLEKL